MLDATAESVHTLCAGGDEPILDIIVTTPEVLGYLIEEGHLSDIEIASLVVIRADLYSAYDQEDEMLNVASSLNYITDEIKPLRVCTFAEIDETDEETKNDM